MILEFTQPPSVYEHMKHWLLNACGINYTKKERTTKLVIHGDLDLHATGTIKISSDEHVIIASGKATEPRPGYHYSVWLNPRYDSNGKPVQEIMLTNGVSSWAWVAEFDNHGVLKIPEGWRQIE